MKTSTRGQTSLNFLNWTKQKIIPVCFFWKVPVRYQHFFHKNKNQDLIFEIFKKSNLKKAVKKSCKRNYIELGHAQDEQGSRPSKQQLATQGGHCSIQLNPNPAKNLNPDPDPEDPWIWIRNTSPILYTRYRYQSTYCITNYNPTPRKFPRHTYSG